MSFSSDRFFITRTAVPSGGGIVEIAPISILRPYIRCFWMYGDCLGNQWFRIIPDCCADIIIPLDGSPVFVGASDTSFISEYAGDVFGIRFYAWAVAPFLHIGMSETFNSVIPVDSILTDFSYLQNAVIGAKTTTRKVELAEKYFMRLFDGRLCSDVINSLCYAVSKSCNVTVGDIAEYCALSKRTLERRFVDNIGITPKKMTDLLRYQLLWQDCIKPNFSAADSAFKLGYYDESHMYNSFRLYHGIGLTEARAEYIKLSHFYNTNL